MPGAQIEWLVESTYAAIPRMHPGVTRVHALAWRSWRRKLFDRETWKAMGQVRAQLREQRYDCVLDLQGLTKSALWGMQAHGPLVGYDSSSGRDPLAALFTRARRRCRSSCKRSIAVAAWPPHTWATRHPAANRCSASCQARAVGSCAVPPARR